MTLGYNTGDKYRKRMRNGTLKQYDDYIKETLKDWSLEETYHLLTEYNDVKVTFEQFVTHVRYHKLYTRRSLVYDRALVEFIESHDGSTLEELADVLSERSGRELTPEQASHARSWVRTLRRRGKV